MAPTKDAIERWIVGGSKGIKQWELEPILDLTEDEELRACIERRSREIPAVAAPEES